MSMYRFENGKRPISKAERTFWFVIGVSLFIAAFIWFVRTLFLGVL